MPASGRGKGSRVFKGGVEMVTVVVRRRMPVGKEVTVCAVGEVGKCVWMRDG